MAEEFSASVEDGLKLSTRLYSERDRAATAAPRPVASMEKTTGDQYLPESPMVYAVIRDPSVVDNPDIPSYQPYVYGRRDPPALIPLYMNNVELQVESFLDTATIHLDGSWRLHCVMGNKKCDCRLAIPMGRHGSILGVEIEVGRKYFYSETIDLGEEKENDLAKEHKHGIKGIGFLKPHIFLLTIPKVSGGSNISIKVRWEQKLQYNKGEYFLSVPFSFPEYVTPSVKKLAKKEKISLNVYFGPGMNIFYNSGSHPLKERKREAGKTSYLYEAEVLNWTNSDFEFSYTVSSAQAFGGALVQAPSADGVDELRNFCLYLYPGDAKHEKVFRKKIVFLVDISKSMHGTPLEATKNAVSEAVNNLSSNDSFNIIAFNGEASSFSAKMEYATETNAEKAIHWMSTKLVASGDTNILQPLNQALQMLSDTHSSIPIIFLVTDGSVENERHICEVVKSHSPGLGKTKPRIYTFGIGSFCNHYFLRSLAMLSRGQHEAAYDIDKVGSRMRRLLNAAVSTSVRDISIDTFNDMNSVELSSSLVPDLTSHTPLIVCGRFRGKFPEALRVSGVLGDLAPFSLDLTPKTSDDPNLFKILAKGPIDQLTTQAWLSGDKNIEGKVTKMSVETGIPSEYTAMELMGGEKGGTQTSKFPVTFQQKSFKSTSRKINTQGPRRVYLQKLGVGFGNVLATAENIPPQFEEAKMPEAAELILKATSQCCSNLCNHCCCMCCIVCCEKMNNQVATALAQCCLALTWLGCFECCSMLCSGGGDGS